MKDRHKKKSHITFALTAGEFARLDVILSKTGLSAERLLGHFFEAMAELPFDENIILPIVPKVKIGGTVGTLSVRMTRKAHSLIKNAAKERSSTMGQIARTFCIRSIELCERHGILVMPAKGEIHAWLKQPVLPPKLTPPKNQPSIFSRLTEWLYRRK